MLPFQRREIGLRESEVLLALKTWGAEQRHEQARQIMLGGMETCLLATE